MPFQKVVMIFNVDSTYQISSKSVNWFQSYSVFEFLGSILTIKKIEFSKKTRRQSIGHLKMLLCSKFHNDLIIKKAMFRTKNWKRHSERAGTVMPLGDTVNCTKLVERGQKENRSWRSISLRSISRRFDNKAFTMKIYSDNWERNAWGNNI